jgi:hypothetical protein
MTTTIDDLVLTGSLTFRGAVGTRLPAGTIYTSELRQTDNSAFVVPLTDLRIWDAFASPLTGTAGTDDLALVGGTFASASPLVQTSDLKNAGATTQYARFQCPIPDRYVAAETFTIRLYAGMETTVASTTATIDVQAYLVDGEGGISADLCSTAATTINSLTYGNKDFTITPTSLTAGGTLDVRIAIAVNDTATGTAVIGSLGRITILADIQG